MARPRMRGLWFLPLALGILSGIDCNRREESQPSPPTAEVGGDRGPERVATAANTPHSAEATARCVVPLSEPPPPRAAPASACPPDPTGPLPLGRQFVSFVEAPGAPRISVEQARTEKERERGLMYRTSIASDEGMLFYFDEDSVRTFWMHNTCIPLDMLFVTADGFIAGILEQVPVLNDGERSVPCPVRYVLEVGAGWARAHGVRPGQKLRIES